MTKRILHVVGCLERGGTEAFLMNHYRALDTSRYQFDFLVFREKDYPYIPEIQALGGRVFFVPPPSCNQLGVFMKKAVACMRNNGPYIAVHSHVNIENAWVMVAAWLAGIPRRISHSHDTIGKEGKLPVACYRWIQSRLIKIFATAFLACSQEAGAYLYGDSFFQSKGHVIHNGICVEAFQAGKKGAEEERLREFHILHPKPFLVGNITRFEPKKNQLFALEIFQALLKKKPDALLILGGPDGGQLEEVKARASQLGLDRQVRFVGPRSDVAGCLQLLDCYLFPSLYEGLGIVTLEAQAAGCPCVASTEVPRDADMGLGLLRFVPLDQSPEVWADALLSTRRMPLSQEEIQAAFAQKGYSIRQSLKQLLEIYEKE